MDRGQRIFSVKLAAGLSLLLSLCANPVAGGQTAVPVGAVRLPRLDAKQSSARPYLFTISAARQKHILIGMMGGVAIGATVGAIRANANAKRCHAESCQVEAALGGLDIFVLGAGGLLVGGVVGTLWPTR